jgi:hypothetical protein
MDGGTFTMEEGSVIAGNHSGNQGGGVLMDNTTLTTPPTFTMKGGLIGGGTIGGVIYLGNIANSNGGGVSIAFAATAGTDEAIFTMTRGTISFNKAMDGKGGGVYVKNGAFDITVIGSSVVPGPDGDISANEDSDSNKGTPNVYPDGGTIKAPTEFTNGW